MRRSQSTFRILIVPEAQADMERATDWLQIISVDTADRFSHLVQAEFVRLRQQWSTGYQPQIDEAASLVYSRPVFQHLFRTSRRRKRSNSGVWRIYYDVADTDGDGQPETLRILLVRHAAAKPLSIEDEE